MSENSKQAAFPKLDEQNLHQNSASYGSFKTVSGLTKRELFSLGMMMAHRKNYPNGGADILAKDAIKDADELLKQLGK